MFIETYVHEGLLYRERRGETFDLEVFLISDTSLIKDFIQKFPR